jgi:hypothetical protein
MDLDPVQIGRWPVPHGLAGDVVGDGRYAFCTIGGDVIVFDVADPAQPLPVGRHRDGSALAVAVFGDFAYYVGGGSLVVLDVTDPAGPREVGRCVSGAGGSVFIDGDYAYAAGGVLEVFDVGDRNAPQLRCWMWTRRGLRNGNRWGAMTRRYRASTWRCQRTTPSS